MFRISEKTDLNQISLTGTRALVLIGLLISKPHSIDEIREAFINLKIMEDTNSDDILRIDLNTIKIMGCEVSRSSPKTNNKYVLTKHPFTLKISEDELLVLKKVYNSIKSKLDLSTLIEYDDLFKKIALHICDEESKEALLGVSVLKYYDIMMVKNLILDCKYKRIIELMYKKTDSSKVSKKEILAQDIVCKNDKIYLYGYDLEKEKSVIFNLRRIKSIISRRLGKGIVEPDKIKIEFSIKNLKENELEDNEEIISNSLEKSLVHGYYHNEFLAIQRMLSFGSRCTVLEPLEFRNNVIEKIKEMRSVYEC